jgi:acetoin utilization protein AcuB
MIVGRHMSKNPIVIGPDDYLSTAREKMNSAGFRRLPVVKDRKLIAIVTDRDLRQHAGFLEKTKVNAAMTETLVTVSPNDTVEKAAQLMLKHKIGGLPVIDEDRLVGIITTSDLLQTFLDIMGASDERTARIDLLMAGEGHDLTDASKAVKEQGGEIVGLGTHREKWGLNPICYLRLRSADPDHLAEVLKQRGYTVVGVYM